MCEGPGGGQDGMINGGRVQTEVLAREFRRRGHQVIMLCGTNAPDRGKRAATADGMVEWRYRSSVHLPVLGAADAYLKLRELDPDVIYVRGRSYRAGVAALFARRHEAVFVWASNGEDGCERWRRVRRLLGGSRTAFGKSLRLPFDLAEDLMCDAGVHRADVSVCQTAHQRNRLRIVHRRQGTVVRTLQAAERTLPLRDMPPVVMWIGRVSQDRRPEAFVELAVALADADCDFVLVGPAASSAYLERVLAPAVGAPRFRYVGPVTFDESWDSIARASVLVNTSPVEGISNALVQAWACGTPTVAMSFDPDGLIERNRAGILSGDMATMIRDVRRLVDDVDARVTYGERAKELAEREFSAAAVGDAYEALIGEALK